jgi:beta-lactamase class A
MLIAAPAATRRAVVTGLTASALAGSGRAADLSAAERKLAHIEGDLGGRLGVAAQRLGGGPLLGHRADERFKMCSTFKLMLAAAILARVDAGAERLFRRIPYGRADLLSYAPTTTAHVGEGGMTVAGLCEAAVTLSDNTAANLLLASLGGPPAFTAFARRLGDRVTRLDRNEPTLNTTGPGDPRDTTSPAAMMRNLGRLAFGRTLSAPSRAQLIAWMVATHTGDHRLRAGIPASARIGDKTGTNGDDGTGNDIAIVWPARGPPILISAYATGSSAPGPRVDAALAAVGRVVFEALA